MLTKPCIVRIIGHSIFPFISLLCVIVSLGTHQWLRYHFDHDDSTNTRTGYNYNNNYNNRNNLNNNPLNPYGNGYNPYGRGNNNIRPVTANKDLTVSFGLYKICVDDDCKKYCDADPGNYVKLLVIVHFNKDSKLIIPPTCDTNLGPTKGLCVFSIFILTFQLLLIAYIFSTTDMNARTTRLGKIQPIHLGYVCVVLGTAAGGVIHFVRKTGGFDTLALDYFKGWSYWWSTFVAGIASLSPFLQGLQGVRVINWLHREQQSKSGTSQTGGNPPSQVVSNQIAPSGQQWPVVPNTALYPNGAPPMGMQPAAPQSYGYNPDSQTLYPKALS